MKILIALIMLSTIVYMPNNNIGLREAREFMIPWGIMIFALWCFRQKIKTATINIWVVVFSLWAVVCTITCANRSSIEAMTAVFVYAVLYWLVVQIVNKKNINTVFNTMCIMAVVHSIWCVIQLLFYKKGFFFMPVDRYNHFMIGFMSHENMLALLLAMTIPMFFRKGWAWFIPLVLFPFLQRGTKGGFIALTAGLIFYVIYKKPKWENIVSVVLILATLGFIYFTKITTWKEVKENGRWEGFERMVFIGSHLRSIGDKLYFNKEDRENINWKRVMFGHGLGQFKNRYPGVARVYYKEKDAVKWTNRVRAFKQAHNEYIQVWFETGLIGLAIIMSYLLSVFLSLRKAIKSKELMITASSFVIIIVNSLVNFPFHLAELSVSCIVVFAMMEILTKKEE